MNITQGRSSASVEPWGSSTLDLHLAGGSYRVTGLTDDQVEVVAQRFSEAVVEPPGDEDAVTIRVGNVAVDQLQPYTPRIPTEILRTSPKVDRIRVDGHHFEAQVDWRPVFGGWIRTCESDGLAFRLAFENFFRLVVAYRLLKAGALLVHAGGVAEQGVADIFIGCSGYGKSTISGLRVAEGGTVLSDDMVALLVKDGELYAQTLPFTGDLRHWPGLGDQFPVRAVMALRKGSENVLSPRLSGAQAMSTLMVCSPYVNTDPHRNEQLMDNITQFVDTCPFHVLTFTRAVGIGAFLHEQLG